MTTRSRMTTMLMVHLACACGLILGFNGCAPKGQSGSMNAAMDEYNSQQYKGAHEQAAAVMAKATGTQRERAAYIAGLSAYQAGDVDAAEQELGVASVSSDPQIAGNAKAMLGQLRLDQRRPREAATCFAEASQLLEGEDARQAAWHAGLAYRQAGDEPSAKRWLNEASSATFDSQPTSTTVASTAQPSAQPAVASTGGASAVRTSNVIGGNAAAAADPAERAATVGFTLQIGAFNDKNRARNAAEDAESIARKEGLGRVRIIPRRDARGQPMYLVQLGWWVTRVEAAAARGKLGRLEYIVAPAPAG